MIEKKIYQCEICKETYTSKMMCQECEDGHKKIIEIKECRYRPINVVKVGYPLTIKVVAEDGQELIYKR